MKKFNRCRSALSDEEGVAAPLIGLFIVIFIIFLAFAVDLGRLYIVKNELQNAADGAALAGARELYQTSQTINVTTVNTAVQNCALQNKSIGAEQLHASAEIGRWNFATQTFTLVPNPTYTTDVNAVRTTVERLGEGDSASANPKMGSFFANILGYRELGTKATAVAYLGITGSASLDIPFALPDSFIQAALMPDAQDSFWGLLTPTPAYAAVSRTLVWKDLGGTPNLNSGTLDLSRGAWVDATTPPSYNNVEPYLSGSNKFPQKKVGDKIYPMSEAYYPSYLKGLFSALKTRYNAKKDANGKWRVTVAIFDRTKPTAAVPTPKPWYQLAFKAPCMVSEAQACTPLTSPTVYIDGFAVVDITGVNYSSSCSNYNYPDSRSCPLSNYITIEIPLAQNLQLKDASASGNNYDQTYKDMNSSGNNVAVFNACPKIVK